ncbi:MAG: hypothetical protein J6X55_13230 [Victivallales bacterium]|nr:hypothetical protein [Victivallales bacterium]
MNEQEKRLREAVLAEAKQEADGILADARKSAKALARKSADAIRKAHDAVVAVANETARKKSEMVAAGTKMDIKRLWLECQEECIDGVLRETLDEAENASGKLLEKSLGALAQEAMAAIGNEPCSVTVGTAAAQIVTESWLEEKAKKVFGTNAKVSYVIEHDDSLSGGMVFKSKDGRKTFDNTYVRRLERMHDELRLLLVND